MKKTNTLGLLLFFISFSVFSQNTWQKTYINTTKHYATTIPTLDGGYASIGSTDVPSGSNFSYYLILTKYDATGTIQWSKKYEESTYDLGGVKGPLIVQTTDSSYYIAGTSPTASNTGTIFLIKINTNGNIVWSKNYSSSSSGHLLAPYSLSATGADVLITAIDQYGTTGGDVRLISVSSSGSILFNYLISTVSLQMYAAYCKQTSDGGHIVVGTQAGSFYTRPVIIKLNSSYALTWIKVMTGGNFYDESVDVQQTSDGGYIVAGNARSYGSGSADAFLLKLDANGNQSWYKTYGDVNSNYAVGVKQTDDGGYALLGETNNGDIFVIKTFSNGSVNWGKKYDSGAIDYPTSIYQTVDNGYIISAGLPNSSSAYLLKTDKNGNAANCNTSNFSHSVLTYNNLLVTQNNPVIAPVNNDLVSSLSLSQTTRTITTTTICSCYIASVFTSSSTSVCTGTTVNFTNTSTGGPSAYNWLMNNVSFSTTANASYTFNNAGTYTIKFAATDGLCSDTSTTTITVHALPTVSYTQNPAMVCLNQNQITLSSGSPAGGTYSGTTVNGSTFYPSTAGVGTYPIVYTYADVNGCSASSTSNIVVSACTGINQPTNTAINIYPNPANNFIIVSGLQTTTPIKIINVIGEVVLTKTITNDKTEIDLSNLKDGIYFVQLNTTNETITKKIIKE